jgi:hypothetical protein
MKKNLQGYALPLALILVAIFSIFVANISSHTDNIIQNSIIVKYQNLNPTLIRNKSNPPSFTFNQRTYLYNSGTSQWN